MRTIALLLHDRKYWVVLTTTEYVNYNWTILSHLTKHLKIAYLGEWEGLPADKDEKDDVKPLSEPMDDPKTKWNYWFFFFFFEIFHWAIPEKKQAGGVEDMEFLRKWDFQWLIKNNVEWWSRKNNVQFPGVLVLGLKISKGCNRILQSFQRWSFVLSAISRGKVRNLKIC